jgi:hypothetical protein
MAKVRGQIAEVKPFAGKRMGSYLCTLTSYL